MKRFVYGKSVPAVRKTSDPRRCPWCGEDTWIISHGDGRNDPGRVEMYCDNRDCDSRETVMLIVRGFDDDYENNAGDRPDVGAIEGITYEEWEAWHARGRKPAPVEGEPEFIAQSLADWKDPDDLWPELKRNRRQ